MYLLLSVMEIDDYYINKLNSIINCLDELTQTNIIIELTIEYSTIRKFSFFIFISFGI